MVKWFKWLSCSKPLHVVQPIKRSLNTALIKTQHHCRIYILFTDSPTTPVVPSPISSSWDLDSWTKSLAIWCSTSICWRMVAPSFVMVTSPSGETIILSRPFGPSDVLRTSAMAFAAKMCDYNQHSTNVNKCSVMCEHHVHRKVKDNLISHWFNTVST